MVIIPEVIKSKMLDDSAQYNIRIQFPNKERTDICNSMIVNGSVKFTESLCSQDEFKFGLCESPQFECELVGVGNIKGKEIDITYEVLCDSNAPGATFKADIQKFVFPISMGRFTVASCERQANMQHRKVVAYGGFGAMGTKMPEFEVFKQSLAISTNTPYKVDLVKMGLSLVDDVPTEEPLELGSRNIGIYNISSENNLLFYIDAYSLPDAHTIDNVLKVKYNTLVSYDALINECKDAVLKLCDEKGIVLDKFAKKQIDNMFVFGLDKSNKYGFLKPKGRYWGLGKIAEYPSYMINDCVINSNLIYPYLEYSAGRNDSGEIIIPYKIRLFYQYSEQKEFIFRNNVSISEMSLNLPRYEAVVNRTRITVDGNSYYRIEDASAITKADYQKVLENTLELIGKVGRVNRNNGFDVIDIDKHFYLLPGEDLKPSEGLQPLGVDGSSIGKSQYSSLWYEESYTKPYGRVYCEYTNKSGTQSIRNVYLNGFNSNSDPDDFIMYSLTSNEVIQNNQYTQDEITEIMETVAESLKNISYVPVKLKCVSIPYAECGDTLEILTQNNDSITTIVMKRTLNGESYITDEFTSV